MVVKDDDIAKFLKCSAGCSKDSYKAVGWQIPVPPKHFRWWFCILWGYTLIIIINDSIYPAVIKSLRTGNKVSCQPNDCPNIGVFKRCLEWLVTVQRRCRQADRSRRAVQQPFVVVCDAQSASSPIAVVSTSRACVSGFLPTVGLSPGSSVQSGCDSGTQERPGETLLMRSGTRSQCKLRRSA